MLDGGNKRIQVYDRNGVYLRTFGTAGTGPGQLGFDTRGLALDLDNGWIYVSDASDGTIEKFSLTGTPLGTFTIPGPDPGTFGGPREITVGQDNNLYVMDYTGERVRRSSARAGQQLREIPEIPAPAPNGGFNQPEGIASTRRAVRSTSPTRSTTGSSGSPRPAPTRPSGATAAAARVTRWTTRAASPSTAQDRTVWLNNTRSAQIKHYRRPAAFLGQFGTQGANPDQFYYSRGHPRGHRRPALRARLGQPPAPGADRSPARWSGRLRAAPRRSPATTSCSAAPRSTGTPPATCTPPRRPRTWSTSSRPPGTLIAKYRHPRHRRRPVRRRVRRRDPRQPDVRLRDGQQPDQRAEPDRPVPRVVRRHRHRATASSAAPPRSRSTPAAACT